MDVGRPDGRARRRGLLSGATPSMSPPASERSSQPGRPSLLIMDVCGAYLRRLGGWIAVGKLVGLMGELGVDEQATRSAVSRMRQRGLLVAETRGDQRGYRLSAEALPSLEESERRIFSTVPPASVGDGWILLSFSIPEGERDRRHVLRSKLEWLGFGNLSGGLWIAPRWMQDEVERMVKELGFERDVTMWEAHHLGPDDLGEVVRRCWDLDELREMYAQFIATASRTARRWRGDRDRDDRDAYVDYTLTLHQWRKFPYLDPNLPAELLPARWEGRRASELFFGLRARLEDRAVAYVRDYTAGR